MITSNFMKKVSLACAGTVLIALGTLGMSQAQAVVVTFDDLSGNEAPIPNGYQGLNWNNFYYLNGTLNIYDSSGYDNGIVSTPNVAYNGFGTPASVSVDHGQFDFNSTYLTGSWNNGLNILVKGSLGGVPKYSQTVTVNTTSPTKFTFNYLGIDNLKFTSSGGVSAGYNGDGKHFALDNFEYNAAPVPEPSTILGSLIAGGFVLSRFCKQKNLKASAKV
ncbi:MAG: PEP-CTERM sorting domain-containing protein [Gloeotrichia echinulata CP02]|nr:PEP-CTERM sorting domain-containing protein [Gloeotrichia echinulata DEX184]